MISEFYPCGLCGDEYFVISSQLGWNTNLRGWMVSDGEGTILFHADVGLAAYGSVSVSWNSTSFRSAYGRLPTISLEASSAPLATANGSFRLGDSGDTLAIYSPSFELVDFVCYGDCNATSPGWTGQPVPEVKRGEVAMRSRSKGELVDTDSASDWCQFREYRYGYTEWAEASFRADAGNLTAFVSPDCSLEIALEALGGALDRISLSTYEFSSVPITNSLLRAVSRGVNVLLAVDGAPAGGMTSEQVACLSILSRYGVDVRIIKGNSSRDIVQHVGAVHAKYIVIDGSTTLIMSENLVEQGFPEDKLFANRGWGFRVRSNELAGYVEGILLEDTRSTRRDVIPWEMDSRFNHSAIIPEHRPTNHSLGILSPLILRNSSLVTVIPSPDSSVSEAYICRLIRTSRSLLAEQFQADLLWEDRWTGSQRMNPIVTGIVDLVRSKGSAKVLFDSSWFNTDRNMGVIDALSNRSGIIPSLGEFKMLDNRSPITSLHNKGAILDQRFVLVSSNNWVFPSFARNRELALLVDSSEAATYFSKAFELDWVPDSTPPLACAGTDAEILVGERATLYSNGSTDDRAIARISWDTDGDGLGESSNSSIEFVGIVPGAYHLVLIVEDSWGNRAMDEVSVEVIARDGIDSDVRNSSRGIAWTIPLLVGGAILLVRFRQRRRIIASPRKLNHGRRS